MSKRESILSEIKATLEDISIIRYVEVDRMLQPDLDVVPLPCAFIYPSAETRIQTATIGQETWEWEIILEVWSNVSEVSLELLLDSIHTQMFANERLGGYADYSYRVNSDFYYIDPEKELKGMIITYLVRYYHPKGTP